ncbi:hypothetical protein Plhal703r1_c37g0133781 [Plasmopara halstedii]
MFTVSTVLGYTLNCRQLNRSQRMGTCQYCVSTTRFTKGRICPRLTVFEEFWQSEFRQRGKANDIKWTVVAFTIPSKREEAGSTESKIGGNCERLKPFLHTCIRRYLMQTHVSNC